MFQSAKFQTGNTNKPVMDSVNMTSETPIGGFIGSAAPNTNSQGMTTITANVDPIQSKVLSLFQKHIKTRFNQFLNTRINTDMMQLLYDNQVKALAAIAEKLGCNLLQLQVAWQVRNQTVQSTTISACTPDALMELLHSLTVKSKLRD